MIIQCPSCSTKFSVAAELVANAENPRFHCSRCSHYFRVEEAQEDNGKEKQPEPKQMSLLQRSLEVEASPPSSPEEEIAPEIASQALEATEEESFEVGEQAGLSESVYSDPDQTSEEIEQDIDSESEVEEQTEKEEESQLVASWPEPVASDQFPFSRSVENVSELDLDDEDDADAKSDSHFADNSNYLESQIVKEEGEIRQLDRLQYGNKAAKEEKPSRVGILLFVLIPALLCVGIFYWSKNLDKTPAFLIDLFHLKPKSLEQVASPLVATKAITAKMLSLEDGTPVLEVSGLVRNSSNRNYRDINIEVTLFDQNSVLLAKKIVSLTNSLHEASSIRTLNRSKLDELQDTAGTRRINFKTVESADSSSARTAKEIPFRVLLFEPPNNVIWYSARVYSAVPG